MKMNWGTGILIAIIAFMIFIFFMVYLSMREDFDLVEKDYYPKALEYQQQIDKQNNSTALPDKVRLDVSVETVTVTFPSVFDPDSISGEIRFYCPADQRRDFTVPIALDSAGCQRLPASGLVLGKYIVKLDYSDGKKEYYQEETVFVSK